MEKEIVFILEPDIGRATVESSQAAANVSLEINSYFGMGSSVNCARPHLSFEDSFLSNRFSFREPNSRSNDADTSDQFDKVTLFRIYHNSTVDGPGRRSVVQFAGCSIRCPGCYVPETHERSNGRTISIAAVIEEIDSRRDEHDGVTILGGEPFDQPESLERLITKLKSKKYHVVVYTGFTHEVLLEQNSDRINSILNKTDVLIDGPYKRELAKNAGEYRGSRNQRLILNPGSKGE